MDFEAARRHMIDSQILTNRVTDDRVIDALSELPRELFVPENRKSVAYVDEAVAIGGGRYVMEPMVIARLLQAAKIGPEDVALCIGSGLGYMPAALSRLANTVVAIESDKALAAKAQSAVQDFGIDTVAVMSGAMHRGYPKQAPYDVVIFDGGVAEIPESIEKQLSEGGRLVAIVGGGPNRPGQAVLVTRFSGALSRRSLFDAGTPMLPGFEAAEAFSF